jgi:hypothetical protein
LRGTHAEAAAAAEALAACPGMGWLGPALAACGYGQAVLNLRAGRPPGQLSPAEAAVDRRYADRAAELVAAALARGLHNAAIVRRMPDMAPLLDHPGVRQALAAMEAPAPE